MTSAFSSNFDLRSEVGKRFHTVSVFIVALCSCSSPPRTRVEVPPTINVLEFGSTPRSRIKYHLEAPLVEEVETSIKVSAHRSFTNTDLETGTQTLELPTMIVRGRLSVASITAQQHAEMSFKIKDLHIMDDVLDENMRQGLEDAARKMRNARATWRLAPNGTVEHLHLTASKAVAAEGTATAYIEDAFSQMFVRFPDVDIGIGAIWETTSQVRISGVNWENKTTFTLRELTKDIAIVNIRMARRAAQQTLNIEPDTSTTLTSGSGTFVAEIKVPRVGLMMASKAEGVTETNYSVAKRRLRMSSTIRTQMLFDARRIMETDATAP